MLTATIAVCTWNRAALLEQCLASLATQIAAEGQIEVLVVDNGSSDGTADVVREWQREGADRRAVVEPRRGVSHARNRALATSERDIVLFVDDDTLTPPSFAGAHLRMYEEQPSVGVVGGPIGLAWPHGRPGWIGEDLTSWYSALDYGDESGPFPGSHGPYAMNMSMRREPALAVGGFDPRFGRRGNRLLSGEEPGLTHRMQAAGWDIGYEPSAAVIHQVLPERLHRRWVLRRGYAQGVSNARLELVARSPSRRQRLAEAVGEMRAVRGAIPFLRRDGRTDVAASAVTLAHAGAALEFTRSAFRGRIAPR